MSLVLLPLSSLPERKFDGSDGPRGSASKHHPSRAGETDLGQSHLSCRQLTAHLRTHMRTGTHTDGMDESIEDEHTYIINTTDMYIMHIRMYVCTVHITLHIYVRIRIYIRMYSTYVRTCMHTRVCTLPATYVCTYVCIWLTQQGLEQLREVHVRTYVRMYWHNMTCTTQ